MGIGPFLPFSVRGLLNEKRQLKTATVPLPLVIISTLLSLNRHQVECIIKKIREGCYKVKVLTRWISTSKSCISDQYLPWHSLSAKHISGQLWVKQLQQFCRRCKKRHFLSLWKVSFISKAVTLLCMEHSNTFINILAIGRKSHFSFLFPPKNLFKKRETFKKIFYKENYILHPNKPIRKSILFPPQNLFQKRNILGIIFCRISFAKIF